VTNEDFELVHTLEKKLGKSIPRCQLVGFEGVTIPESAPGRKPRAQRSFTRTGGARPSNRPQRNARPHRRPETSESSTDERTRPARDEYRSRSGEGGPRRESRRDEGGSSYGERSRPARNGGYRSRNGESKPAYERSRSEGDASFGERPRPARANGYRSRNGEGGPRRERSEERPAYGDRPRTARGGGYRSRDGEGAPNGERGYSRNRSENDFERGDRRETGRPRKTYGAKANGKPGAPSRKPRAPRGDAAPYERNDQEERGDSRPKRKQGPGGPARKGKFSGTPRAKSAGASRPRRRTR
jgi:hypothetical protein